MLTFTPNEYRRTLHLVWKLLHNDAAGAESLQQQSIPGKAATLYPRHVRIAISSRDRMMLASGGNEKKSARGCHRFRQMTKG